MAECETCAPETTDVDDRPEVQRFFGALKTALPDVTALWQQCTGQWGYEDPIYRFYHQSFKFYALQEQTVKIAAVLQALCPDRRLNDWFMQIIQEGTGKTFTPQDNSRWLTVTRPIVEAFFHARYFLEMAVIYGTQLSYPPRLMPSGWAALLTLYNLR